MVDILIKNMEKPKSCDDCKLKGQGHGYEECLINGDYAIDSTYKDCPLVSLPEHGRLKDTDFMLSCLEEIKKDYPEAYKLVSGIIERTPTIVEAST